MSGNQWLLACFTLLLLVGALAGVPVVFQLPPLTVFDPGFSLLIFWKVSPIVGCSVEETSEGCDLDPPGRLPATLGVTEEFSTRGFGIPADALGPFAPGRTSVLFEGKLAEFCGLTSVPTALVTASTEPSESHVAKIPEVSSFIMTSV